MQRLGLSILFALAAFCGFSDNEFGSLAEARAKHPNFFKPGVVTIASINQEDWYVYCGDAEKCLSSESENELYEEAQVQAKMNFFNHFAKKDPGVKLEVIGARRLYRYADKEMRFVVMGVPVKGVVVKPGTPVVAREDTKKKSTAAEPKGQALAEKQLPTVDISLPQTGTADSNSATKGAKTGNPVAATNVEQTVSEADTKKPLAELKTEKPTPEKPMKCQVSAQGEQQEVSDDEKLIILRGRIEAHPEDYRLRMRMAKIFARQGKTIRAFNNYRDAARLLIGDANVANVDKAAELFEIAQYEESARKYSFALKHYRIVRQLGDAEMAKKANTRISLLLLRVW